MKNNIYLLSNKKHDNIKNINVFQIEYIVSDIDLLKYDGIIFTSKNGIYSLNSFNKTWKDIPCYAIAPKTASVIEEEGGKVIFIGESSHGNDFANELIPYVKDKKILYIRAQKVVSNLVNILKNNNIDVDELVTYKTICSNNLPKIDFEKNSTFIFTSPSSVNCFFKNYSWDDSFYAISIGKTTAEYLPSYVKYEISAKTSIDECIKLAQNR